MRGSRRDYARRAAAGAALVGVAQGMCVTGAVAQASDGRQPVTMSAFPAVVSSHVGGWRLVVAPYLWASGVSGKAGVRGQTAEVDISFRKIIENLDFAFMLTSELRRGSWGIGMDALYLKLSKGDAVPRPPVTSVEFELSQFMLELSPRYRVLQRAALSVDAIAGVRYVTLKPTLTLEPLGEVRKRRSWADPIVGARLIADLASHWLVQLRGDLGGFGMGSEFTWQALALGGYRFSNRVSLRAGYRYLDIDFEDSDDEFVYDIATHGPIVGVAIAF